MRVTFWGTRGSIAAPSPETTRYGGNTSCVELESDSGTVIALDAGTGIRRLGAKLPKTLERVDVLLTHLHMDHVQGLGFFEPLYRPDLEVHIWGPSSTTMDLRTRLSRYMSPPLFPVRLRDLPCRLELHEVPCKGVQIGDLVVDASFVLHPGPTVGYRITGDGHSVAYIPDHEPGLGVKDFPISLDWTSGSALAANVDLLIHDSQYTEEEYPRCIGWGHCSIVQTFLFAQLTQAKKLVPFHYDPSHDDAFLDHSIKQVINKRRWSFEVEPAAEGQSIEVGNSL